MTQPPQVVKPFGRAIDWTADQLDRLSEVTDADIEAASLHWQAYAPRPYKSLLDAVVEE